MGKALADQRPHLAVVPERSSKVQPGDPTQPVQVLDQDRFVESMLGAETGEFPNVPDDRRVGGEQSILGSAGDHFQEQEGHQGYPQEGGDQVEDPPDQVGPHPISKPRIRIGVRAPGFSGTGSTIFPPPLGTVPVEDAGIPIEESQRRELHILETGVDRQRHREEEQECVRLIPRQYVADLTEYSIAAAAVEDPPSLLQEAIHLGVPVGGQVPAAADLRGMGERERIRIDVELAGRYDER